MDRVKAVLAADRKFFCGTSSPEDLVQEWEATGLGIEVILAYMGGRVYCSMAAVCLHQQGISPEQASQISPATEGRGAYSDTYGYKVSKGDLCACDVPSR